MKSSPNIPREVFPDVAETLKKFRKEGYRLGLITRGLPVEQQQKLRISGLEGLFDEVHAVLRKDSSLYQSLAAKSKILPNRICMVGDSLPADIFPAIQAGWKAVYIPPPIQWGLELPSSQLQEPGFYRVKNMSELRSLFFDEEH